MWAPLPGSESLSMMDNGQAAHTINVPMAAMGKYIIFRVVSTSSGGYSSSSFCRAFALSPTLLVDGTSGPLLTRLTDSSPAALADVATGGFVASWTYSAPVYFPTDGPAAVVVNGINYYPEINGNQLTVSVTGSLPASTPLTLTVAAVMDAPGVAAGAGAYFQLQAAGQNCAGNGGVAISDRDECENAASVLNLGDTGARTTATAGRPEGCYYTSSLWLGTNPANAGHGSDGRRKQICGTAGRAVVVPSLSVTTAAAAIPAAAPVLTRLTPSLDLAVPASLTTLIASSDVEVALGSGNTTITNTGTGVVVCDIPASASSVTASGTTLTVAGLSGHCQLRPNQIYNVALSSGVVLGTEGGAGNDAEASMWRFSTQAVAPTAAIDMPTTMAALTSLVTEDIPITVYFTEEVFGAAGSGSASITSSDGIAQSVDLAVPASGTASVLIRAPVFSNVTNGYQSRTQYSIDFEGSLQDAGGNALSLSAVSFTTGDSHAPSVIRVDAAQQVYGDPVVATIQLDESTAVLQAGGGSFYLHRVSTGEIEAEVTIDSNTAAVSFMPGMVHVSFAAAGLPVETQLSVRWSAGVLTDDHSNGITGHPRLYSPDPARPDDPNKYQLTTAQSPRGPPPPPMEFVRCNDTRPTSCLSVAPLGAPLSLSP